MKKKNVDRKRKSERYKLGFEYNDIVISQKIRIIRKRANLTQEELAKKIKTTRSAISRYENNNYHRYSIFLLEKITMACNADLQISFILVDPKNKMLIRV